MVGYGHHPWQDTPGWTMGLRSILVPGIVRFGDAALPLLRICTARVIIRGAKTTTKDTPCFICKKQRGHISGPGKRRHALHERRSKGRLSCAILSRLVEWYLVPSIRSVYSSTTRPPACLSFLCSGLPQCNSICFWSARARRQSLNAGSL